MKWDQVFCHVCNSLLQVTATYGATGSAKATGFIVARYRQPSTIAFALATAGHVFRDISMYTDVEWMVQSYNWMGQERGYASSTSNIQKTGGSPY